MLWLHRVDPFGRYIFFTIRFCFLFRYRFCLRLHAFKRTRGVTDTVQKQIYNRNWARQTCTYVLPGVNHDDASPPCAKN